MASNIANGPIQQATRLLIKATKKAQREQEAFYKDSESSKKSKKSSQNSTLDNLADIQHKLYALKATEDAEVDTESLEALVTSTIKNSTMLSADKKKTGKGSLLKKYNFMGKKPAKKASLNDSIQSTGSSVASSIASVFSTADSDIVQGAEEILKLSTAISTTLFKSSLKLKAFCIPKTEAELKFNKETTKLVHYSPKTIMEEKTEVSVNYIDTAKTSKELTVNIDHDGTSLIFHAKEYLKKYFPHLTTLNEILKTSPTAVALVIDASIKSIKAESELGELINRLDKEFDIAYEEQLLNTCCELIKTHNTDLSSKSALKEEDINKILILRLLYKSLKNSIDNETPHYKLRNAMELYSSGTPILGLNNELNKPSLDLYNIKPVILELEYLKQSSLLTQSDYKSENLHEAVISKIQKVKKQLIEKAAHSYLMDILLEDSSGGGASADSSGGGASQQGTEEIEAIFLQWGTKAGSYIESMNGGSHFTKAVGELVAEKNRLAQQKKEKQRIEAKCLETLAQLNTTLGQQFDKDTSGIVLVARIADLVSFKERSLSDKPLQAAIKDLEAKIQLVIDIFEYLNSPRTGTKSIETDIETELEKLESMLNDGEEKENVINIKFQVIISTTIHNIKDFLNQLKTKGMALEFERLQSFEASPDRRSITHSPIMSTITQEQIDDLQREDEKAHGLVSRLARTASEGEPLPLDGQLALAKQLAVREKDLEKRWAELSKREAAVAAGGKAKSPLKQRISNRQEILRSLKMNQDLYLLQNVNKFVKVLSNAHIDESTVPELKTALKEDHVTFDEHIDFNGLYDLIMKEVEKKKKANRTCLSPTINGLIDTDAQSGSPSDQSAINKLQLQLTATKRNSEIDLLKQKERTEKIESTLESTKQDLKIATMEKQLQEYESGETQRQIREEKEKLEREKQELAREKQKFEESTIEKLALETVRADFAVEQLNTLTLSLRDNSTSTGESQRDIIRRTAQLADELSDDGSDNDEAALLNVFREKDAAAAENSSNSISSVDSRSDGSATPHASPNDQHSTPTSEGKRHNLIYAEGTTRPVFRTDSIQESDINTNNIINFRKHSTDRQSNHLISASNSNGQPLNKNSWDHCIKAGNDNTHIKTLEATFVGKGTDIENAHTNPYVLIPHLTEGVNYKVSLKQLLSFANERNDVSKNEQKYSGTHNAYGQEITTETVYTITLREDITIDELCNGSETVNLEESLITLI